MMPEQHFLLFDLEPNFFKSSLQPERNERHPKAVKTLKNVSIFRKTEFHLQFGATPNRSLVSEILKQ